MHDATAENASGSQDVPQTGEPDAMGVLRELVEAERRRDEEAARMLPDDDGAYERACAAYDAAWDRARTLTGGLAVLDVPLPLLPEGPAPSMSMYANSADYWRAMYEYREKEAHLLGEEIRRLRRLSNKPPKDKA